MKRVGQDPRNSKEVKRDTRKDQNQDLDQSPKKIINQKDIMNPLKGLTGIEITIEEREGETTEEMKEEMTEETKEMIEEKREGKIEEMIGEIGEIEKEIGTRIEEVKTIKDALLAMIVTKGERDLRAKRI